MALSNELVSQFAKLTQNSTKKKDGTIYGTTVTYNNQTYVRLDGSDLLTPVFTTADTIPGERVTVVIDNHTAVITGNVSSPSARLADMVEVKQKIVQFDGIIATKADIEDLEAVTADIEELNAVKADITDLTAAAARITSLEANKADIVDLTAATARITNLETENVTINGLLSTANANITNLQTTKLNATDAALQYANINFTNISNAAMTNFYANSGLIDNVTINQGVLTGNLIGVTISGDLIEANSLKANKLLVQGEDGLYYKLNIDGLNNISVSQASKFTLLDSEPDDWNDNYVKYYEVSNGNYIHLIAATAPVWSANTYYKLNQNYETGLDGTNIIAQSITASKISVSDLVAFGATIGGFHITQNSIYSGVKSSVDNTTRGIYMDNSGQIVLGDGTNYLKYYFDTDSNTYKLDIFGALTTTKRLEDNPRFQGEDCSGYGVLSYKPTTFYWGGNTGKASEQVGLVIETKYDNGVEYEKYSINQLMGETMISSGSYCHTSWLNNNYKLTTDTAIDPTKTYYEIVSATGIHYIYAPVENPVVSDLYNYYELDNPKRRRFIINDTGFIFRVENNIKSFISGSQKGSGCMFIMSDDGIDIGNFDPLAVVNILSIHAEYGGNNSAIVGSDYDTFSIRVGNRTIFNGDFTFTGDTYFNKRTYFLKGMNASESIIMNNGIALRGYDKTNNEPKSLIYINSNDNVIVNGNSSGNTNIYGNGIGLQANTTVAGTLIASGVVKSTGGSVIANDCTSWDGGVAGGYISTTGRMALVSPSSTGYPNIMFVVNKSTSKYTQIRSTNASGTYTVTLPSATGTLALSSSDIRIKENIKPSKVSALDLINKIRLYEFDWKEEFREGGLHWAIGMIADELEKLDKNLVFGGGMNDDGTINVKGIDIPCILAYIIGAIQELQNGGV